MNIPAIAATRTLRNGILKGALVTIFALLTVNSLAPEFLNADTILFSIMSLQKVTLFYWAQDRVANFIPLAFSLVHRPDLNLALHLFVFSASYFGLLIVSAKLVVLCCSKTDAVVDQVFVFALLTLATLSLLQRTAQYSFLVEGQPYALSYLLLAIGFLPLIRATKTKWTTWCLVGIATVVATGLNPSILVAGVALFGGTALFCSPSRRWRFVSAAVVLLVCFLLWHVLSKSVGVGYPVKYSEFSFVDLQGNFLASAQQILRGTRLDILMVAIVATLALRFFVINHIDFLPSKVLSGLLLFAFAWILVLSNSAWVTVNASHYRYFFPVYFAFLVTLAICGYLVVRPASSAVLIIMSALMLLGASALVWRSPVSGSQYSVARRIADPLHFALEQRISYIAGDYWTVWPTVLGLLVNKQPAFGVTARGEANMDSLRQSLSADITKGKAPKAICISMSPTMCLEELHSKTGLVWEDGMQDCASDCRVYVVRAGSTKP